ncbi:hypothetical protein JG688_00018263, partial [Phytophthora aleatoria]
TGDVTVGELGQHIGELPRYGGASGLWWRSVEGWRAGIQGSSEVRGRCVRSRRRSRYG